MAVVNEDGMTGADGWGSGAAVAGGGKVCYDPVLPPLYFFISPYLFSHMTLYHLIGHLTLVT